MKILYKITKYLMFLVVGFLGCGCSSEPEEPSFDPANEDAQPWEDNISNNKESDLEIKRLIEESVSVKAEYYDYTWYFTIESTLHNQLPSKKLEYGIGHGDLSGNEYVSVGNEAYKYSIKNDGKKEIMIFTIPFFFYYGYGIEPSDFKTWEDCRMYYGSYTHFKNQGYDNLNEEEKAFYQKLQNLLDKYEKPTKWNYCPSVQVLIDNRFYLIGRYHLK